MLEEGYVRVEQDAEGGGKWRCVRYKAKHFMDGEARPIIKVSAAGCPSIRAWISSPEAASLRFPGGGRVIPRRVSEKSKITAADSMVYGAPGVTLCPENGESCRIG